MGFYLAFCKDTGGTEGVLPVAMQLRELGHIVSVIADEGSRGAQMCADRGIDGFRIAQNAEEIRMWTKRKPDGIITSMCGGDSVGRDSVALWRDVCPTFALQDAWGARLLTDWKDPTYRPDYLIVNDEYGKRIVQKAWPEFQENRIVVFGYPALDRYYNFDFDVRQSIKKILRGVLGLKEDWPVVLFAGGGACTSYAFHELVEALNDIGKPVYLIPRPHPAMKKKVSPEEMSRWHKSLADLRFGSVIDTSHDSQTSSYIFLSDVVCGMFSTVQVEAAVLRKTVISILYPEHGQAAYQQITGGLMSEFPLVKLGCSLRASSLPELISCLKLAIFTDGNSRDIDSVFCNQQIAFDTNGVNGMAVSSFILSRVDALKSVTPLKSRD